VSAPPPHLDYTKVTLRVLTLSLAVCCSKGVGEVLSFLVTAPLILPLFVTSIIVGIGRQVGSVLALLILLINYKLVFLVPN